MLKSLIWLASCRADLKALPLMVQDDIGYRLYQAQLGHFPDQAKSLKGFRGVIEIIANFDKNTYRAVYATKIDSFIYVLHIFQKKSKYSIKTPREDLNLIKSRLYLAELIAKGGI